MNSSQNHINNTNSIDVELLNRYYNNDLSAAARNKLEKVALNDPFLKDAMDGFDENPGSFNAFYEKHKKQLRPTRKYTLLIGIVVLLLMVGATYFFRPNELVLTDTPIVQNTPGTIITAEIDTLTEEKEYEVLATEIDTLALIPVTEIISVAEVVTHQDDKATEENAHTEHIEKIDIEEPVLIENDFTIEDENIHKLGQASTPTSYLFDLLVIDYREIERTKENISYKRYELGGVSADVENSTTEIGEEDLIEREVEIPYFTYLDKSMYFFAKSRFKQALNRYLIILEQYPEDINALFYGGLAYYNLGKYENSISFFDIILSSDVQTFMEEAMWYKAKCLIKLKQIPKAKALLDEIIILGGFYSTDAILLKEDL